MKRRNEEVSIGRKWIIGNLAFKNCEKNSNFQGNGKNQIFISLLILISYITLVNMSF